MTQEQLGFAAEVERNFVSLIERGANQPALRIIFRLAKALNISPAEMLKLVEEEMSRIQEADDPKR